MALADCASVRDASELIGQIWSGLERTSGNFGHSEVVNWWADLLHEVAECMVRRLSAREKCVDEEESLRQCIRPVCGDGVSWP
jgi:hypothetical protein